MSRVRRKSGEGGVLKIMPKPPDDEEECRRSLVRKHGIPLPVFKAILKLLAKKRMLLEEPVESEPDNDNNQG